MPLPAVAGQSLWRGSRLLWCFARALKPLARCMLRVCIDRGEQLLHGTCRRRAQRLVEADCLREFLPDEFVALRKFAVLCKRPIDTLGLTTIQRPGRVPWQQRLDLVALTLFVDHVQGQLARCFRLKLAARFCQQVWS